MEFLTGVLFAVCFFGVGYGMYKLGQRSKRPVAVQVDEEEQRKQKRFHQDFQDMMTYDVHTALKGKRVSE